MAQRKRICFVTGTRAEFGLMRSTLRAVAATRGLQLQLVVTGMHLHAEHGRSIDAIRREGWTIDAVVPWRRVGLAEETGLATAGLAKAFDRLESDVILVVGDRVEAFAAATAGHLSRRIVAHVHGGDRAEGQVDDSLRHAITKLSHLHFPATPASASRIVKLGEDRWRVHQVGSPGLDGIKTDASNFAALRERFPGLKRHGYALVVLHPIDATETAEHRRASDVLDAVKTAGLPQTIVIYPNNDPGSRGIIRCWRERQAEITHPLPDAPRDVFLGLMRDCAAMVGNSSAGIIEAVAFGTPVINVGDRQAGRERGENVSDVPYGVRQITRAVKSAVRAGRSARPDKTHPYDGGRAGERIAGVLSRVAVDDRLRRKLIAY